MDPWFNLEYNFLLHKWLYFDHSEACWYNNLVLSIGIEIDRYFDKSTWYCIERKFQVSPTTIKYSFIFVDWLVTDSSCWV